MIKRQQALRGVLILVGLLLAFLLWPKPCEQYGGMLPGGSWDCSCLGVKVTTRNEAPVDGLTIRKCVGIATQHRCSKPELLGADPAHPPHDVKLVPCD